MADECIFCRIIKGEIPAHRVYENDLVLAILDINPIAHGHALVMPKRHLAVLTDLAPDILGELVIRAQQVARGVVRATGAQGLNLLMNNHRCAGQAIAHVHWHIIPRHEQDGIRFNWSPGKYAEGQAEKQAAAIRDALK